MIWKCPRFVPIGVNLTQFRTTLTSIYSSVNPPCVTCLCCLSRGVKGQTCDVTRLCYSWVQRSDWWRLYKAFISETLVFRHNYAISAPHWTLTELCTPVLVYFGPLIILQVSDLCQSVPILGKTFWHPWIVLLFKNTLEISHLCIRPY